jgi:radical SAM enzyme (TIGR01210 family)
MLSGELEVALGLETVHPDVLPALNKRMTVDDFDRAASFLSGAGIAMRAFILLKPPYLDEEEGVEWAIKSIEHAFAVGVRCCSVIATRAGNGMMEQLQSLGEYTPPGINSLESVLEAGLRIATNSPSPPQSPGDKVEHGLRGSGSPQTDDQSNQKRVFVDLWEAEQFCRCMKCGPKRVERLRLMNLTQEVLPPVECDCGARA